MSKFLKALRAHLKMFIVPRPNYSRETAEENVPAHSRGKSKEYKLAGIPPTTYKRHPMLGGKDCGVNIKTAGGFIAAGDAGKPKRCESSTQPGKSI